MMTLQGKKIFLEETTFPCKEAGEAMTYAILSLFCFGFVLGPMAISKAHKARQIMNEDPRLDGYGKANAATVIGIVGLVIWVLSIIGRASRAAHSQ